MMPTVGIEIERAVGEGFPFPLFRLQDGFPVSPWRAFLDAPKTTCHRRGNYQIAPGKPQDKISNRQHDRRGAHIPKEIACRRRATNLVAATCEICTFGRSVSNLVATVERTSRW